MSVDQISNLIAKRFIQRRDVRAIQLITSDGTIMYMPDGKRKQDGSYSEYYPWDRTALNAHVSGKRSLGHYLLDQDDNVKLFAFDIDLEQKGWLPVNEDFTDFQPCDPRKVWQDRSKHYERNFIKLQFKSIAHLLLKAITEELNLPCAAAYSGGKGIHVYGFTGSCPATDARDGAWIVLDSIGRFRASRGQNFFIDTETDHSVGYQNLSIELFPKQNSLQGKDLGNLMRLPLGVNLKNPRDPTFFIDMNAPLAVLRPVDPEFALSSDNPWQDIT